MHDIWKNLMVLNYLTFVLSNFGMFEHVMSGKYCWNRTLVYVTFPYKIFILSLFPSRTLLKCIFILFINLIFLKWLLSKKWKFFHDEGSIPPTISFGFWGVLELNRRKWKPVPKRNLDNETSLKYNRYFPPDEYCLL